MTICMEAPLDVTLGELSYDSLDFEHFKKAPDDNDYQRDQSEKLLPSLVEEEEEREIYDKLRIFSSLSQFQIKIFRGEPKLVLLSLYIIIHNQCVCSDQFPPEHA